MIGQCAEWRSTRCIWQCYRGRTERKDGHVGHSLIWVLLPVLCKSLSCCGKG